MKYADFLLLNPAGEWERWRVPTFFNARDVAEHRPHSEVFMFVPGGRQLSVEGRVQRMVNGPVWAAWSRDSESFVDILPNPRRVPASTVYAMVA